MKSPTNHQGTPLCCLKRVETFQSSKYQGSASLAAHVPAPCEAHGSDLGLHGGGRDVLTAPGRSMGGGHAEAKRMDILMVIEW